MTDEYKNFITQFSGKNVEYRKKPTKIFPRPKFDMVKALKSLASGGGLSSNSTSMNEPVTSMQRSMGESLRFRNLLDIASDQSDICTRLAYMAAFSVSAGHTLCQGRNAKSFECILGETFELYDPTDKLTLICEQVSNNPSTSASHSENEKWEIHYNLCTKVSFQLTKIKYDIDAQLKYRFKNDGQIFTSNRPSLFAHDLSSENRWLQYKGDQVIQHVGTKARVELSYEGCERYSKENCIKGKIFDQDNKLFGTLEGNYLTKLVLKKNSDSIVLWELEENDETLLDHFSFKLFTLQMNDPVYPVDCPTDSRLRPDIRFFEEGNFDEADRYKIIIESKQSEEENTKKKQKCVHEPKWFKKVYDETLKKDFYIYGNEYWSAKLEKNFKKSPELFRETKA